MHRPAAACLAVLIGVCSGCVQRTISITSEPPGALVWMNHREVGRTPLDVEFLTYGTYDVRLTLDAYEPLLTSGDAPAPWWDVPGPDIVSAILPLNLHSRVQWHYDLEPAWNEPGPLVDRARELRDTLAADESP